MDDVERYFDEHAEPLFRYLVRLTGDVDRASDAMQSAFLRVVERRGRLPERAWLYTVATRAAIEELRTDARRRRLLGDRPGRAPIADPPRDPHERVEADERARRTRVALMTLSEKERSALLLREAGFSQREIADTVGTTTGSVGTLIARALLKFAAALPPGSELA